MYCEFPLQQKTQFPSCKLQCAQCPHMFIGDICDKCVQVSVVLGSEPSDAFQEGIT